MATATRTREATTTTAPKTDKQKVNPDEKAISLHRVKDYLTNPNMMEQLQTACADRNVTHHAVVVETLMCIRRLAKDSDKIWGCTLRSIGTAALHSARSGLLFNSRGDAWIVPYKDSADFQPGYQGMLQDMHDNGAKNVRCDVVYAGDTFDVETDDNGTRFVHKPKLARIQRRREVVCAYAWVKWDDDETQFTLVEAWDLNQIKNRSKSMAGATSPWKTDESEMMKKTAIRRLYKTARRKSRHIEAALEVEDTRRQELEDILGMKDGEMIEGPQPIEQQADDSSTSGEMPERISRRQVNRFWAVAGKHGWNKAQQTAVLEAFETESPFALLSDTYEKLCGTCKKNECGDEPGILCAGPETWEQAQSGEGVEDETADAPAPDAEKPVGILEYPGKFTNEQCARIQEWMNKEHGGFDEEVLSTFLETFEGDAADLFKRIDEECPPAKKKRTRRTK